MSVVNAIGRHKRVLSVIGLGCLVLILSTLLSRNSSRPYYRASSNVSRRQEEQFKTIRFANLGNSMQYNNDLPRLLEKMCNDKGFRAVRKEYLRGGENLSSLWNSWQYHLDVLLGRETIKDILEDEGAWDFIIMNDHSQWPAREETRQQTLETLKNTYAPILTEYQPKATPIFVLTQAYQALGAKNSDDLGDYDEFSSRLTEGYTLYKEQLDSLLEKKARVAPVGLAFSNLYESNEELWRKLYSRDGFHPSPYGTLLQASVIFWTVTGEAPPAYDQSWWEVWRKVGWWFRIPTQEEGDELFNTAAQMYQVSLAKWPA